MEGAGAERGAQARATDEGAVVVLRVLSLNVHCWEDAEGRDNVAGVIELIKESRADVVVLQEVTRWQETLDRIGKAVHMDFFAVVILSSPLLSSLSSLSLSLSLS